jgi:hypothetical protein
MKYVAYIKVNGKVYPQLWDMDFSKPIEKRLGDVVAKYEIKAYDQGLSFDRLIEKYPYPPKVENEKAVVSNDVRSTHDYN